MNITESTESHAVIVYTENSTDTTTPLYAPFLDAWTRKIVSIGMEYVVNFGISLMGIVTNMFVLLVFARQGYAESIAISMSTIAVWDFIKCLVSMLDNLAGLIQVWNPAFAVTWATFGQVSFVYINAFSTYVTSVMAAYTAIERCLCVSMPFKVKWMLTPKVTLTACIIISTVVFGCFAVIFGIYKVTWIWDDNYNATVAVYEKSSFSLAHEGPLFAYYNISGVLWPLTSFVVIVVCTAIIVHKLRKSSKFRAQQGTAAGNASVMSSQEQDPGNKQKRDQAHQLSNRDRQVVKMLLVIIAIYIGSLAPRIALYIAKYIVYDFYFLRKYHYLFEFICFWIVCLDVINGSVNFFVFYFMSSTFKATFREMVCSKPLKNSSC